MDTFTARIRTHYTADAVSLVNQGKATPLCRNKPMGGRKNMIAAPVDCERCIKRAGTSAPPVAGNKLEDKISQAYAELVVGLPAGDVNRWVSLTDLRPRLGRADRAEVDAALDRMIERPDVRLMAELNQRLLTDADHDAAVEIGNEPRHLLKIAEAS